MLWKTWASFSLVTTMLCLYPGPAVLLVLSQGISRGASISLFSTLGILAGDLFYFFLSATSLGAFLLASTRLFLGIKWLGAAYLVWIGLQAFLHNAPLLKVDSAKAAKGNHLFRQAFFLQLANPKALLFFTAFLPQFLDLHRPLLSQILVFGLTCTAINFLVLGSYGIFAGRIAGWLARPGFTMIAERLAGAFLIAAGIGLSWMRF